jgi:hypothetical protein
LLFQNNEPRNFETAAAILKQPGSSQNTVFGPDRSSRIATCRGFQMARAEITGRKLSTATGDLDAYSVDEFCRRHGFSPQLFYKLKPKGLMPPTFRLGARVLIAREAAAKWRAEREGAASKAES